MVHEPMTKEMCEQKHNTLSDNLKEIKVGIHDIKHILNGNGKMGLVSKVEILWSISIFLTLTIVTTAVRVWWPQ